MSVSATVGRIDDERTFRARCLMESGENGAAFTKKAAKRRNCDRVRRWQRAQQARGRCRCGGPIAPGSKSQCLACLERSRLDERRRHGITTAGRRHRGRPPLGDLGARTRAFEQDEAWEERRSDRWAGCPDPFRPSLGATEAVTRAQATGRRRAAREAANPTALTRRRLAKRRADHSGQNYVRG